MAEVLSNKRKESMEEKKMQLLEVILIGVGLAMDAFAVSICKGLQMQKINYQHATIISIFFGGFQAFMPFIGWLLGKHFERYITKIDHWIAFFLLGAIGLNMLKESMSKEEEVCQSVQNRLDIKELVLLSIATSIDALAVGITFAFLQVRLDIAIAIIGTTTFFISFGGVVIGNIFGTRYKGRAERFGGFILIAIGVKILLEHLGIFVI